MNRKSLPRIVSRSHPHDTTPTDIYDRPAGTQRRLPRWRRPPPQLCVRRDAEEGDVQEADTVTEQRKCQLLQDVYCSRCCPSCDECSHSRSSRSRYSHSIDAERWQRARRLRVRLIACLAHVCVTLKLYAFDQALCVSVHGVGESDRPNRVYT